MSLKIKKLTKIDSSIILFIIFYIFMLRGLNSETYIRFILVFLWIFIAFVTSPKIFLKSIFDKYMILVWVYLFYFFTLSLFHTGLKTSIGFIIGRFLLFIGILAFNYYKRKISLKQINFFLKMLILIWIYYSIKAIYLYNKLSFSGREIVSHQVEFAIGDGYGLAYGAALLGVYLFGGILLNSYKKENNKYIIFILIILTTLILFTGSTIALLAYFIGLVFNIYVYINKKLGEKDLILKIMLNILLTIIILIFLINLGSIGLWIVNIAPDNLYGSRLELIGRILITGKGQGTLGTRLLLYKESLSSLFNYPIFGVSYFSWFESLGDHSELFDTLGRFGLLGSVMYFSIFIYSIIKERLNNRKFLTGAYIFSLLVLFILNPFHYTQSNFILFFIIPSVGLLVKNRVW